MSGIGTRSTRRAFFAKGGAVLGAGVASTVGVSALAASGAPTAEDELIRLRRELDQAQEREAIRRLHLAFAALIESRSYESAVELFDERATVSLSGVSATGKAAIRRMFAEQYREQRAAVLHCAYRPNARQQKDVVTIAEDRSRATATYHVDVQLGIPLQGDCTAAQMARLQGQLADCRWESGRLEARYVKSAGEWKIASLSYLAS